MADINKLRQVFINVLGNAVKFTERGGIGLRVRVDRGGAAGPCLRVEIEDTGPGISADDQEKLFRHFEQTKTGQQAGTGTGLGLAISREFVRLMGGDITVKSQVGRGSIFVDPPAAEGGRGAGGAGEGASPGTSSGCGPARRRAGCSSSTTSRTTANSWRSCWRRSGSRSAWRPTGRKPSGSSSGGGRS